MKSFLMLLAATLISFATFAQKAKANIPSKSTVQVQYTCPMHPEVVSDKEGKCPKCGMDLSLSKKEQMKRDVMKSYTCPVHADVVSDHAGKCSKCSAAFVIDRKGSKQGKTIYSCSMHPEIATNKAGKCPVCGMELKKATPKKS